MHMSMPGNPAARPNEASGDDSVSIVPPVLRYSWRVRDCLMCAWYELPSPLTIDEMWRLLVEGRHRDARRLE